MNDYSYQNINMSHYSAVLNKHSFDMNVIHISKNDILVETIYLSSNFNIHDLILKFICLLNLQENNFDKTIDEINKCYDEFYKKQSRDLVKLREKLHSKNITILELSIENNHLKSILQEKEK